MQKSLPQLLMADLSADIASPSTTLTQPSHWSVFTWMSGYIGSVHDKQTGQV